jgi:ribonuclease HI
MARRPCCPLNCSTGALGFSPTNWSSPSKHGGMPSTCSNNRGTSLSQGGRHCANLPRGGRLLYVIRSHFHTTNIVVEYEALKNSLRIDVELGVQILYIYGDSELVVNQVMGELNYHDNNRSLESWRRSSMILNFIISSGRTMKQPMPSLDSGLAMKHHPPQACSCKTYSSCPSGSEMV